MTMHVATAGVLRFCERSGTDAHQFGRISEIVRVGSNCGVNVWPPPEPGGSNNDNWQPDKPMRPARAASKDSSMGLQINRASGYLPLINDSGIPDEPSELDTF